jgi:phage N-6-adenine-methyltransferase
MKTEKELRQEWRTPQDFFDMLDQEVGGFDIDVAADASNTKCWLYLDKDEDDALSMMSGWFTVKPKNGDFVHPMKAWCNPPYDNPSPWITKAFVETTVKVLVILVSSILVSESSILISATASFTSS